MAGVTALLRTRAMDDWPSGAGSWSEDCGSVASSRRGRAERHLAGQTMLSGQMDGYRISADDAGIRFS